jgi:hypothetical protein
MGQIFTVLLILCTADPCERPSAERVLSASFANKNVINGQVSNTPCQDWLSFQLAMIEWKEPMRLQYTCRPE